MDNLAWEASNVSSAGDAELSPSYIGRCTTISRENIDVAPRRWVTQILGHLGQPMRVRSCSVDVGPVFPAYGTNDVQKAMIDVGERIDPVNNSVS
jgi:hypothetical protein